MDLEFTDDQEALRDSVRDLLANECPASVVRELVEKGVPADGLWAAQVETGWPALALPEAAGGLGLGPVEVALVAEEAGRVIAPGPWLSTATQYAALISEAADPAQQAVFLPSVAEGRVTGALALSEDPRGLPPTLVQTTATARDGGWHLRGRKYAVLEAETADELVVVASIDSPSTDRLGVFVVPAAQTTITPVPPVDRSRSWATVDFDTVVTSERSLGEPGLATEAVQRGVQLATVALAAEIVGTCAALVDRTIEYAKQRQQFGVPIGSFQAIKHKLADDYVAVERARAAVYFAALTIAEDDPQRGLATSMAKAAAGDCEHRVAEDALQTHGGIGYTWEHDLHLWLKRAKSSAVLLGGAAWHRARIADLLGLPRVAS